MQLNMPFLRSLRKRAAAASGKRTARDQPMEDNRKNRREQFIDWLSPKPAPIQLFPGEQEVFRKGLVLVTDTRLAYIDPFDRMLKTYMFEHMVSLHKQFYHTTVFNRRLCKGLLFVSLLALLIILIIDLLDSGSNGFFLVYLPLLASILIGVKVWNDMKPRYVIHWRMRDHTYGEIIQEPLLRERIKNNNQREVFMTDLANAMNQALSGKAWWPANSGSFENVQGQEQSDMAGAEESAAVNSNPDKTNPPTLSLVTDSYQQ